jgi:hypothetical protein
MTFIVRYFGNWILILILVYVPGYRNILEMILHVGY